jgi:hypothetical protein
MRLVGAIAFACATTFAGAAEPTRPPIVPAAFSADAAFPTHALVWQDLDEGVIAQGVRSATDLGKWGTLRVEYSFTRYGPGAPTTKDVAVEWRKRLDGAWFGGLRLAQTRTTLDTREHLVEISFGRRF